MLRLGQERTAAPSTPQIAAPQSVLRPRLKPLRIDTGVFQFHLPRVLHRRQFCAMIQSGIRVIRFDTRKHASTGNVR